MIGTIKLLLPALIPSWRFFKTVECSPRIEYRLLDGDLKTDWREYVPRAQQFRIRHLIQRLFYNADWNEQLFINTCAERLDEDTTGHSLQELRNRIAARLPKNPVSNSFQFRVVFIARDGEDLVRSVDYESEPIDRSPVHG